MNTTSISIVRNTKRIENMIDLSFCVWFSLPSIHLLRGVYSDHHPNNCSNNSSSMAIGYVGFLLFPFLDLLDIRDDNHLCIHQIPFVVDHHLRDDHRDHLLGVVLVDPFEFAFLWVFSDQIWPIQCGSTVPIT